MKSALMIALALLTSISAHASTIYTCYSKDFSPQKNTGQSLDVTTMSGTVTEIKKNKGSWYSSGGVVVNPKMLARNERVTVYQCDFRDDSTNGRLIVPNTNELTSVEFSFSDAEAGKSTSKLSCFKHQHVNDSDPNAPYFDGQPSKIPPPPLY